MQALLRWWNQNKILKSFTFIVNINFTENTLHSDARLKLLNGRVAVEIIDECFDYFFLNIAIKYKFEIKFKGINNNF
jgi:hypothetical protein